MRHINPISLHSIEDISGAMTHEHHVTFSLCCTVYTYAKEHDSETLQLTDCIETNKQL